jgi:hypothetical protein
MEQDWPLSRVSVAPRLPPPCPAGTAGACNPPSLVLGDNLACNCGIAVIAYVSKPKESKKNTDICADSYRPLRATVPPKLMFCKSARVSTSTGSLNPQLQVQQSDKCMRAIAACLVRPSEKVISISGDGAFLFSAMELESAVRLKCNLVHLVWIDGSYDMVAF